MGETIASAPAAAAPSHPWLLPAIVWTVVAVLGGTLAWALPRATEAEGLEDRLAAISAQIRQESAETATFTRELLDARSDLAKARADRNQLQGRIHAEDAAAERLAHQIQVLNEQAARIEAAEEAVGTPSQTAPFPTEGPDMEVCYDVIDADTGKRSRVCK